MPRQLREFEFDNIHTLGNGHRTTLSHDDIEKRVCVCVCVSVLSLIRQVSFKFKSVFYAAWTQGKTLFQ